MILIKSMLNHDPVKRPSGKELLLNELVPRKADEIALDELLTYSLTNKQSTNYRKILKAVFDQKNNKVDDFSFDATNCKDVTSCKATHFFGYLQTRESVFNLMIRVFQRYGGFMFTYPLLMPWNELCYDFNKAYKLTDASGLVVALPYNHRVNRVSNSF